MKTRVIISVSVVVAIVAMAAISYHYLFGTDEEFQEILDWWKDENFESWEYAHGINYLQVRVLTEPIQTTFWHEDNYGIITYIFTIEVLNASVDWLDEGDNFPTALDVIFPTPSVGEIVEYKGHIVSPDDYWLAGIPYGYFSAYPYI